MGKIFYARPGQILEHHLKETAELSQKFAQEFQSGDWGYLAGLWHDLGKFTDDFQKKLSGVQIFAEHSGAGAFLAVSKDTKTGLPLAFVIAGHHSGLTNFASHEENSPRPLQKRIYDNKKVFSKYEKSLPEFIKEHNIPDFPDFITEVKNTDQADVRKLRFEMWVRFLFSCLIDADRLNSMIADEGDKKIRLRKKYADIQELSKNLDDYINSKIDGLSPEEKKNKVNKARRYVLECCREKAETKPGIFSLTVPTGGGKTLSSMSFALRHAVNNNLHRVIVVIPYTSIIEQNAKVYKNALGIENVIEHHSSLDPEKEKEEKNRSLYELHKFAVENWEAPVIVTTSVQFFETLFSNKTSRCRKLHNITKSVIIMDEIQTLPPEFLNSILDGMKQLVDCYGCSMVLSTATPPALIKRDRFPQGLPDITPIIEEPEDLSQKLKRIEIEWPDPGDSKKDIHDLADMIEDTDQDQLLCIVHRRKDARELAVELKGRGVDGIVHLSALMCPAHRLGVIDDIRQRLQNKQSCRVISTQLVEAGVDLDFPIVFRALAGLDSIVQAGGRCNREGNMKIGKVKVFHAESKAPPGGPRAAMEVMESMITERNGQISLKDPAIFDEYFRELYFTRELDEKNIQANRKSLNFATVGKNFKLIQDGFTHSIVASWGNSQERLDELKQALNLEVPMREHLRKLQPFTVNIYDKSFNKLMNEGAIEEVINDIYTLYPQFHHLYHSEYGLVIGDDLPPADPNALITKS